MSTTSSVAAKPNTLSLYDSNRPVLSVRRARGMSRSEDTTLPPSRSMDGRNLCRFINRRRGELTPGWLGPYLENACSLSDASVSPRPRLACAWDDG